MLCLLLLPLGAASSSPAALPTGAPPPPISLPGVWGSNMVLQRGQPVPLWGFSTGSSSVSVAYRGATHTAPVAAGVWRVTLPAAPASATPTNISISSGNATLTLANVLVGDVFVCSGQSNMALPVDATYNQAQELHEAGAHGAILRVMQVRPPPPSLRSWLRGAGWLCRTPRCARTAGR